MNRRIIQVVTGFLLLVGLCAGLLFHVRSNYTLAKPGIKLVDVPIYNERTNIVSNVSAYLPASVGEYTSSRVEPITGVEQGMLPPDTVYGRRVYTAPDGFKALTSIVLMGTDRTSIHKPQYCLTGQGESIVNTEIISIPITRPHPYDLRALKLTTRSERRTRSGETVPVGGVFIYWFVADGYLTHDHVERMWLMAKEFMTTGRLQRWAYVAYFANCPAGQEEALTTRLKNFISEAVPECQLTTGVPTVAATPASAEKLARN
jgi:hypothetical protein